MKCLLSLLGLSVCLLAGGCSSLGFSTYPVAHMMTDQTKAVLDSAPRHPQVARELSKEVMPVHYLQPGDELLVEAINGDSEIRLPADQQLAADGSLDLGKYGRIIVASLTLEDTERLILQTLSAMGETDVTVNVRLLQHVHRFYVIGEVNSPGAYPLTGYETVLDGIMAAGGLTSRASACDLMLARPTDPCSCRVTLPICYRAITQLGDTTTNYQLKPGDRIFVARQSLREEMFACCSKKECDRCCGRQVACCDPSVGLRTTPEFGMIQTNTIAPPTTPTDGDDTTESDPLPNGEVDAGLLDNIEVEPWTPPNDRSGRNEPSETPAVESPQPRRNIQDGQLDFDPPSSTGNPVNP